MLGRELIKKIIDENGLDKEYGIITKSDKDLENAMKAKSLSDICEVSIENDEVVLVTDFPLAARKFGLSDKYEKYIWDGRSVYFHKNKNEASSWSIDYGSGGYTLVSDDVKKYCITMVEEMVKQIFEKDLDYPEWIEWRISRYEKGGDFLNVFGDSEGLHKHVRPKDKEETLEEDDERDDI